MLKKVFGSAVFGVEATTITVNLSVVFSMYVFLLKTFK